jgi:hypothetical protein
VDSGADEPKPPARNDVHILARVVLIHCRPDTGNNVLLEKPQLQRLGDTPFLVGRWYDPFGTDTELDGKVLWIPTSDIMRMVEFGSVRQAQKALERQRQAPAR